MHVEGQTNGVVAGSVGACVVYGCCREGAGRVVVELVGENHVVGRSAVVDDVGKVAQGACQRVVVGLVECSHGVGGVGGIVGCYEVAGGIASHVAALAAGKNTCGEIGLHVFSFVAAIVDGHGVGSGIGGSEDEVGVVAEACHESVGAVGEACSDGRRYGKLIAHSHVNEFAACIVDLVAHGSAAGYGDGGAAHGEVEVGGFVATIV